MKKKTPEENEAKDEATDEVDLDENRFHKEQLSDILKYTFTEKEKTELGAKLAQCFSDCAVKEADLKSVQTQFKSEIAKIEGEMAALSEKIRSGYEHRTVRCEKVFDYRLGTVTYTRLDTGEVYRERPMDEMERQQTLNLEAPEDQDQAAA